MSRRISRHERHGLADDLSTALATFTSSMRQVKLPTQQAAALEMFTRSAHRIIQDVRRRAGDRTRILQNEPTVRLLTCRAASGEEVAEVPNTSIIDFYLRELAKRADQRVQQAALLTQRPRDALPRVRTAGT